MGILLQIMGVFSAIASLATGIFAIQGKTPAYISLILLFIAVALIKYGRKNTKK